MLTFTADTLNDKHFIGDFNNTIYRRRYLLSLAVMKENTVKTGGQPQNSIVKS